MSILVLDALVQKFKLDRKGGNRAFFLTESIYIYSKKDWRSDILMSIQTRPLIYIYIYTLSDWLDLQNKKG